MGFGETYRGRDVKISAETYRFSAEVNRTISVQSKDAVRMCQKLKMLNDGGGGSSNATSPSK
jgi:hypothetical protein